MKAVFIIIVSCLLIACTPPEKNRERLIVTEGVKKQVEEEGKVTANDGKSKVHCERIKKTGSNLVRRVCYTEDEWTTKEQRNRDALEKAASRNTCQGRGCGGDGG